MKFKSILDQPSLPKGFQRITLEDLSIPSGLVITGDPFSLPSAALNIKIKPAKYKVDLIYKDCLEWGYRVALAMLIINDAQVVDWKPLKNMQGFDSIFVGSGLACFVDFETAQSFSALLEKWRESNPPKNYYDLVLKNEIQKKVLPGERINSFGIHYPFNNSKNIAIFECGVGDGGYKTYCGVNKNGNPSVVLIDFDILDWV